MPPLPRRFFLLPPTHFKVAYSINQWMDPRRPVDQELAMQQWQHLVATYRQLGARVDILEIDDPLPDHVFPGDSVFLYADRALASRFRHPERAGEVEPVIQQVKDYGFEIHRLPPDVYFEGNGDAIVWNGRVLAGFGPRSSRDAHAHLAGFSGLPVVSLEVQPPHFHVDTCVCPLDAGTLAYVKGALSPDGMAELKRLDADLIEISWEEGLLLAGNCISIDGQVILSTDQAPIFSKSLEEAGFVPRPINLGEFAKSGGGAKCLTLESYPAAR